MHRKRRLPETRRGAGDPVEGPSGAKIRRVRFERHASLTLLNPLRKVFASLNNLRIDNKLCDWVIRTNDNEEMPAHSVVLTFSSPYFQRFLLDSRKVGLKKHIINLDLPSTILQQILDFTYTGKCILHQENFHPVLIAAKEYHFYEVVRECYQFIKNQLSPENCISIYHFTKHYFTEELSSNLVIYICHNFREILVKNRQILELTIDEMLTILGSDDLNIADERSLFLFAVRWIDQDVVNRERHILNLMKCLRFGLMDPNFIKSSVMVSPYVIRNQSVQDYLSEGLSFLFQVNPNHAMAKQRYTNDVVLVFGGWTGNFERNYGFIEVFDKCAARWFPMTNIGSPNEKEYYYHGVCVLYNIVYMIGGCCESQTWSTTSKVVCFDPVRKLWEEKACMHEARSNLCVVAMEGFMYAIGGFDRFFNLESAERYDPSSNQWEKIASMNDCRSEASAAALHGKIYVAGGFATDDVLQSVEVYDPRSDQWSFIQPLSSPRYGHSLVSYEGALYAVGGNDGMGHSDTVERYEPINAPHWTYVGSMTTPRKDFAAVVLDDKIYVVGGSDDWSSVASTESYDVTSGVWTAGPQLYQKRCGLAACVVSGLQNVKEYSYVAYCAREEEEANRMQQDVVSAV